MNPRSAGEGLMGKSNFDHISKCRRSLPAEKGVFLNFPGKQIYIHRRLLFADLEVEEVEIRSSLLTDLDIGRYLLGKD